MLRVIPVFREEKWHSMDLNFDMLVKNLENHLDFQVCNQNSVKCLVSFQTKNL